MPAKVYFQAFWNVCKTYWPISARIGFKAGIISILGCGFLMMGDPKTAVKVFNYLFCFIIVLMAAPTLIAFTGILRKGRVKAMTRVKVDFHKEWEKVWHPAISD